MRNYDIKTLQNSDPFTTNVKNYVADSSVQVKIGNFYGGNIAPRES